MSAVISFDQQLTVEESPIEYKCKQCDFKTTRKRLFDAHQQLKHVERDFKCEECGHLFARQIQLTTHHDSVHMGRKQELTVESSPVNPHEVSIAEIKYKCK